MAKTFSYRRLEVVSGSPAAEDFKERWPALFCEAEIKEEFRRLTTISLEQSFMNRLDTYTPKMITLLKLKGGVVGTKLRPYMDILKPNIEMRREAVIRSLILYLGEKEEELFEDCQEDNHSDTTLHTSRFWLSMELMERIQWTYPLYLKERRSCRDVTILRKLVHCLWDSFMPSTSHTPEHCVTLSRCFRNFF
ncbi:hypothetical protein QQF64_025940 [Cirrhinus molitorella]|uniref:Uncharacterized protein n=1 Tax=Cirrhinus molitorella TaxID=172907 RepID=A0ABR3NR96_9TELE